MSYYKIFSYHFFCCYFLHIEIFSAQIKKPMNFIVLLLKKIPSMISFFNFLNHLEYMGVKDVN